MLLIVAIVVVVVLTRSNGDPEWVVVEKAYLAETDPAARLQESIFKLNTFLERFPDQSHASTATVYRDLARLRQSFATKTDWTQPLAVAQEVLPKMLDEADFPKGPRYVGQNAAGDGGRFWRSKRRMARRGRCRNASGKLSRPSPDWRWPRTGISYRVRSVPGRNCRRPATKWRYWSALRPRDAELEQATAAIRASIAAGNMADAFARRDQLCDAFPELQREATVESIDDELAAGEAKAAKVDTTPHPAETKPRADVIATTVLLARSGTECRGRQCEQPARGSDRPRGDCRERYRGRRAVRGHGILAEQGRRHAAGAPLRRVRQPAAGSDRRCDGWRLPRCSTAPIRNCFVSRRAMTATKWRQPLGDAAVGRLVISGGHVFAALRSGKLVEVDLESGAMQRSVALPERMTGGPAISADAASVTLLGERGTRFTIAVKDFSVAAARSPETTDPIEKVVPHAGDIEATIVHRAGLPVLRVVQPDKATGKPKWEIELGAPIVGEPAVNADGSVQCLSPLLGSVKVTAKESPAFQADVVAAGKSGQSHAFVSSFLGIRTACSSSTMPTRSRADFTPATGVPIAAPFQPSQAPSAELSWRLPAVVAGKQEAIATDGHKMLYRLGLKPEPVKRPRGGSAEPR